MIGQDDKLLEQDTLTNLSFKKLENSTAMIGQDDQLLEQYTLTNQVLKNWES